jgi:hypothetical protein
MGRPSARAAESHSTQNRTGKSPAAQVQAITSRRVLANPLTGGGVVASSRFRDLAFARDSKVKFASIHMRTMIVSVRMA